MRNTSFRFVCLVFVYPSINNQGYFGATPDKLSVLVWDQTCNLIPDYYCTVAIVTAQRNVLLVRMLWLDPRPLLYSGYCYYTTQFITCTYVVA